MSEISSLQPELVWRHFDQICAIAHPSCHEQALRDALCAWAQQHNIETVVDPVGNLLLRKGATPGCEGAVTTALQAHLDMVPQKNSDCDHDFLTDPVRPRIVDGWVKATGTTLGADNGIGMAAALAALEADDYPHGPLEVLLTVNEERGMSGAIGLAPDLLEGGVLLNLDTEEWGEFYLGCAGGMDVNVSAQYQGEVLPSGWVGVDIALKGLKGGHSGCDIHLERGNANKLMVRLLKKLNAQFDLRLARFSGGTLRNAIAREAFVTLALPADQRASLETAVITIKQAFDLELAGVDDGLEISCSTALNEAHSLLPVELQKNWLAVLHSCPHGVARMSQQLPGVVETSNNLARIEIGEGEIMVELMPRSLIDSAGLDHGQSICSLFELIGAKAQIAAPYPGWRPVPDSELLALSQRVFEREFGKAPELKVIHAGLECGILGSHYPNMQMISLGPTMIGAHSPDEALEIATVAPFWQLLRQLLSEIGSSGPLSQWPKAAV